MCKVFALSERQESLLFELPRTHETPLTQIVCAFHESARFSVEPFAPVPEPLGCPLSSNEKQGLMSGVGAVLRAILQGRLHAYDDATEFLFGAVGYSVPLNRYFAPMFERVRDRYYLLADNPYSSAFVMAALACFDFESETNKDLFLEKVFALLRGGLLCNKFKKEGKKQCY